MEHNDETKGKIKSVEIKILDDGSFLYQVQSEPKETKSNGPMACEGPKQYATDSIEKVMDWLKDDLGSPHQKKEGARHGDFDTLKNRIMSRPGFKPRYAGQSKEQAASAVTASIKDKLYGKSWRKD